MLTLERYNSYGYFVPWIEELYILKLCFDFYFYDTVGYFVVSLDAIQKENCKCAGLMLLM